MTEKVWLITGASSGLGLALAEYVLSKGDKVIATVRSLALFPESLRRAGGQSLVLDLNASDDEIRRTGEEALKVYGYVDVLVNNAGYGLIAPVEEMNLDEARAQMQTNVFGAIALTQALLPSFRVRRTGHILNISSISGFKAVPSWGAYCASKAALEGFSKCLSQEVAPFNIRVHIISPGYFATDFWAGSNVVDHGTQSTVYAEPSQGFGLLQSIPKMLQAVGNVGDPVKLAARVYEVVHETGMARELVEHHGEIKKWLYVPLGPDCGERMIEKIGILSDNVRAFEKIWRSTDADPERLKFLLLTKPVQPTG